jgi:hypothetical protein
MTGIRIRMFANLGFGEVDVAFDSGQRFVTVLRPHIHSL